MKNAKKYMLSVLFIALFGEMYFYPYQDAFRFSAGVIAISIILLYTNLKEVYLGLFTGLLVFLLRGFLNFFRYKGSIIEILKIDLPGAIYYILFGVFAYFLSLRKNRDNPLRSMLTLFSIDVAANIIESLFRLDLNPGLFKYILIIATFRSIFSYIIFSVLHNQEILLLKREHRRRYAEQNTIISNIQAEMFYLDKSMKDIEDVMSKSYKLYEDNKGNEEVRSLALDIAREVHEIKKDYYRVIDGFKDFLINFGEDDSMSFKDISIIIQDNIQRYLSQNNKTIHLSFKIYNNIHIVKFYSLFTILNNLIINAIDASLENGKIQINEKIDSGYLIIDVIDNGQGIDEDLIPYIFEPGFTTKFDEKSGEASTGIGLSHIQNMLENLKGEIRIDSQIDMGTKFTISIPLNSLER